VVLQDLTPIPQPLAASPDPGQDRLLLSAELLEHLGMELLGQSLGILLGFGGTQETT